MPRGEARPPSWHPGRGAGRSFPVPGSFTTSFARCEWNPVRGPGAMPCAARAGGRIAPIQPTGLPPVAQRQRNPSPPLRTASPRPRERSARRLNCCNSTGVRVARSLCQLSSRLLLPAANGTAAWSRRHAVRSTPRRSNCANSTYGAAARWQRFHGVAAHDASPRPVLSDAAMVGWIGSIRPGARPAGGADRWPPNLATELFCCRAARRRWHPSRMLHWRGGQDRWCRPRGGLNHRLPSWIPPGSGCARCGCIPSTTRPMSKS